MPITTSKLNIFEPIKLPIDKSFCFFKEATIDAANSGTLVPIATIVILIILSEISSLLATDIADFIRVSEPNHKRDPLKSIYRNDLKIEILGRGFTWLDTGTHDSLLEASNFIKTVEKHSGFKVACLEEIAYKMNFIDIEKLKNLTLPFGDSNYGQYLKSLINEN